VINLREIFTRCNLLDVIVEIFWRRRFHYKSFQVDSCTYSSSLKRGYRWFWANKAICNIFQ